MTENSTTIIQNQEIKINYAKMQLQYNIQKAQQNKLARFQIFKNENSMI